MTLRYALAIEEPDASPFPLIRTVTIGRHLDNDLVLAGEDVRDFHVRVEIVERGPRVTVLEQATAHVGDPHVGDRVIDETFGMMPGDVIVIGHHRIRVELSDSGPTWGWRIHDVHEPNALELEEELLVGRGEGCALKLREGHISRRHAVLKRVGNTIWVKDLGSSNGTFVNGERVTGARRLFHGDEVAFDLFRYQLIGDDPELTPIRPPGAPPIDAFAEVPLVAAPEAAPGRAEPAVPSPPRSPAPDAGSLLRVDESPSLIDARDGRPPVTHRLRLGRQQIGSAATADVRVSGHDVAERHAEIDLRADGAILTHLAPGAATLRNGKQVSTARLLDGDILQFGAAEMTFRSPAGRTAGTSPRKWIWLGVAAATGIVTGLWFVLN